MRYNSEVPGILAHMFVQTVNKQLPSSRVLQRSVVISCLLLNQIRQQQSICGSVYTSMHVGPDGKVGWSHTLTSLLSI